MKNKPQHQKLTPLCKIGLLILFASMVACNRGVVYVPEGSPVRIRETIKKAKVWAQDEQGKWIEGRMDLPEGWYALPDPGEE